MRSFKRPTHGNELHRHTLIRSTAIEMAAELYADAMRDNTIYEAWKSAWPECEGEFDPVKAEIMYIEMMWPLLVRNGSARATLARSLNSSTLTHDQKMTIHEALVLDAGLRRGRVPTARITNSTVRTIN